MRGTVIVREPCLCGSAEMGRCGDKHTGFGSDLGPSPRLTFPGHVSLGAALGQAGMGFRVSCGGDRSSDGAVGSSPLCPWWSPRPSPLTFPTPSLGPLGVTFPINRAHTLGSDAASGEPR